MSSKRTAPITMPAFLAANVSGESVRYQFHGKEPLRVAVTLIAKALHGKDDFRQLSNPLIIASGNGKRWVANRSRVGDQDLAQLIPNAVEREPLWSSNMLIRAEELRIYNPWQEKPERRKLPLAVIQYHLNRDSVLVSLDATEDELVAVMREIVESHILGVQEPMEVEKFLYAVSLRRMISDKESRTRTTESSPKEDKSASSPQEELRRYLLREMRMGKR